jgi:hypothetical protein
MKKSTIVITLIVIIIFSCIDVEKKIIPVPSIIASYSEEKITIDGIIIEPVWQKTQSVVLRENKTGNPLTDSTYLTEVKTLYDLNFLYISFLCNDPDIWGKFTRHDQHLWTEEAVEVFIDTDTVPITYVEIEVSPNNVLFDSYIVDPVNIDIEATKKFDLADIKTAVSIKGSVNDVTDEDRQWSVEIAIPLNELVDENYMIIPGRTEWRINFYRIERARTGESVGYAWSPTGARFHKPSVFGVLKFADPSEEH